MATEWTLCFESDTGAQDLAPVAEECFERIQEIESLLSMFIEDSDIARCNRLQFNETALIAPETYRCLTLAEQVREESGFLFDAAYRSLGGRFILLTKPHRLCSQAKKLVLDLGGIGKGFALDAVAEIVRNEDETHALLCASTSTVLAVGRWEIAVNGRRKVLSDEAISCSSNKVNGEHIFNPLTGVYAIQTERAFSCNKSAALADAWSTVSLLNM